MSFSALATAACGKWTGNEGLIFEIPFTFLVIYVFSLFQKKRSFSPFLL